MTIEITEKQFERQVKHLARLFGWLYYHTWRSIHSPAGFPDVVIVRGERLIFAELKSAKGIVSDKQQEWIDALGKVPGIEVYLWKPDEIEEIARCLR